MPRLHSENISVIAPAFLRRFFLAFLVAVSFFLVLVSAVYRQDVVHQRSMLASEAQHVLDLQQELLLFEFDAVQSDLLYLASQDALTRFLSGDTSARRDLERTYVKFAMNKPVYDQIRCLDETGQEIVRVNWHHGHAELVPQDELQSKADRYYFQQALSLSAGEVFVSEFDLNMEFGEIQRPIKPVIRFLTPMFDNVGKKRGLLVLNYLGAHVLEKTREISAGFRGDTMVLNSQGEFLQAPNSSHEWGWLLDHQHSFRRKFPVAWDRCKSLRGGQVRLGPNQFTFQRISPGHRTSSKSAHAVIDADDCRSLILISYTSPSIANEHARELLNQHMFIYAGIMAVIAVLSYHWARSEEIRRLHERRIVESESRLRRLSSELLAAQEQERRNFSRDLHDELGQQVTAISLDLRLLKKKLGGIHLDPLLQRAIKASDQLLESLHEIAARVRPSVLDDLGLNDAIESLLSEYEQRTCVKVSSHLEFHQVNVPPKIAENVYRILQEALSNVAKHAQVDQVQVTINTEHDVLRMTVHDSGVGFDLEELRETTRLGLLGMRERVELLSGQFEVASTPGHGTRISIAIPLPARH